MLNRTLKESVVVGAIWVAIERWLTQTLNLLIYVLLARLLGPDLFGLVALAGVYVLFIEVLVNQGLRTALVQRMDLDDEHLDSVFWVNLAMGLMLVLGSIAVAKQVAVLFNEPQLAALIRWMSCVLVLSSLSTIPHALLVRHMAFRSLSLRSLLGIVAGGVVGLSMAWAGFGEWSLVGQQISSALVGTAVLWWSTSWKPSWRMSRSHLRDVYGFSINLLGTDLLWYCSQRVDQTLIGYAFGASALGPYALATRFIVVLKDLVTSPLQVVALPALSKLQNDWERLRNAFYNLTEVSAAVALPTFCGIAALSPLLVPLLFGEQWVSAVPMFQVLAFYGAVQVPMDFGHPLMISTGRSGVYLMLSIFQVFLTIVFCLVATRWSPIAIGYALSLATIVHVIVYLLVCQRLTGISVQTVLARIWAPALMSILMFVAVSTFQAFVGEWIGKLATIVIGVFLGVSIYSLGMRLLCPQLIKHVLQDVAGRFKRAPLKEIKLV